MEKDISTLKDARIVALSKALSAGRVGDKESQDFWYKIDQQLFLAIARIKEEE